MNLFAEISAGELIDKITILEIKLDRIGDEAKRANIARELAGLIQALEQSIGGDEAVAHLRRELKTVNAELWRIEDDIRAQERAQDFGALFVSLARSRKRPARRSEAPGQRRHWQRARRGEKLRRLLTLKTRRFHRQMHFVLEQRVVALGEQRDVLRHRAA